MQSAFACCASHKQQPLSNGGYGAQQRTGGGGYVGGPKQQPLSIGGYGHNGGSYASQHHLLHQQHGGPPQEQQPQHGSQHYALAHGFTSGAGGGSHGAAKGHAGLYVHAAPADDDGFVPGAADVVDGLLLLSASAHQVRVRSRAAAAEEQCSDARAAASCNAARLE
jgi:hypothetical protein